MYFYFSTVYQMGSISIEQVCTLREKADYEEKDITDDEMADVVKFIERIDIVLNKIAY